MVFKVVVQLTVTETSLFIIGSRRRCVSLLLGEGRGAASVGSSICWNCMVARAEHPIR